jgi:hypothetical protein
MHSPVAILDQPTNFSFSMPRNPKLDELLFDFCYRACRLRSFEEARLYAGLIKGRRCRNRAKKLLRTAGKLELLSRLMVATPAFAPYVNQIMAKKRAE